MPLTFRSRAHGPSRLRGATGFGSLAIALLTLAPLGLHAETAAPAAPSPSASPTAPDAVRPGRYTMVPAEGGFVRLDTETGAVSHCRRGDAVSGGVWQCASIPEDVIAKPAEKGASDDAALRREVADLRARIEAMERRSVASAPPLRSSGDPELDKAMNFSEELMRRFFGLVREFKDDVDQDRI
jgi:hypothetical protein